jgi:hypothetical protein
MASMTTLPAAPDLDLLLGIAASPKLTIVIPLESGDSRQTAIRARNLVREADQQLAVAGADPATRRSLTAPVSPLIDEAGPFSRATCALAVFTAPGFGHLVPLSARAPELVAAGDDFHLLATAAALDPLHCHVLTLARGGNRLWRAGRCQLSAVELPGAPAALEEVTWFRDLERQLQYHSTGTGGSAAFHGQGVAEDTELEPVRTYLREIDTAVRSTIGADSPLLLIGPGRLPAIYRKVSRHRAIVDTFESHPDGLGGDDLAEIAAVAVDELARQRTADLLDEVGRWLGSNKSSNDPIEVELAAAEGRVQTLLFDPDSTSGSGNRALLETIRHGGSVVPAADGGITVAAVFRY